MSTATYRGVQYNVENSKNHYNELALIKARLEKLEKLQAAQMVMAGKKGN